MIEEISSTDDTFQNIYSADRNRSDNLWYLIIDLWRDEIVTQAVAVPKVGSSRRKF